MSIYFIQAESGGPVKIGYSQNPLARLSAIQCHNTATLRLLGLMDGDREVEASLHRKFSSLHLRGEWFEDSQALRDEIAKLPAPPSLKRNLKFTIGDDAAVLAVWRDLTIQTDREAAQRIGRNVCTLRHHLGMSGRNNRQMSHDRAVAIGSKGGAQAGVNGAVGRMPFDKIEPIWFDQTLSDAKVMAAVNGDPAYPTKISHATIWRNLGARYGNPDRGAGRPRKPKL